MKDCHGVKCFVDSQYHAAWLAMRDLNMVIQFIRLSYIVVTWFGPFMSIPRCCLDSGSSLTFLLMYFIKKGKESLYKTNFCHGYLSNLCFMFVQVQVCRRARTFVRM